jgi:hypothetical protein
LERIHIKRVWSWSFSYLSKSAISGFLCPFHTLHRLWKTQMCRRNQDHPPRGLDSGHIVLLRREPQADCQGRSR